MFYTHIISDTKIYWAISFKMSPSQTFSGSAYGGGCGARMGRGVEVYIGQNDWLDNIVHCYETSIVN